MCWRVHAVLQTSSESQVKKLEEQLSDTNRRGDDLQRALTELTVAKNRLAGIESRWSDWKSHGQSWSLLWSTIVGTVLGQPLSCPSSGLSIV